MKDTLGKRRRLRFKICDFLKRAFTEVKAKLMIKCFCFAKAGDGKDKGRNMRILTKRFVGVLLLLAASSSLKSQIVQVGNCTVDLELMNLPPCAVETRNGQVFILKELAEILFTRPSIAARQVKLDGQSLACVFVPGTGWSYINRNGHVIVKHVAFLDNGGSPFHHGLVRINLDKKWGLANATGRLVVPLEFDGILEFNSGRWLACKRCKIQRIGEYSIFTGGSWFAIDQRGRVVGKAQEPR